MRDGIKYPVVQTIGPGKPGGDRRCEGSVWKLHICISQRNRERIKKGSGKRKRPAILGREHKSLSNEAFSMKKWAQIKWTEQKNNLKINKIREKKVTYNPMSLSTNNLINYNIYTSYIIDF